MTRRLLLCNYEYPPLGGGGKHARLILQNAQEMEAQLGRTPLSPPPPPQG